MCDLTVYSTFAADAVGDLYTRNKSYAQKFEQAEKN